MKALLDKGSYTFFEYVSLSKEFDYKKYNQKLHHVSIYWKTYVWKTKARV